MSERALFDPGTLGSLVHSAAKGPGLPRLKQVGALLGFAGVPLELEDFP